ncbi:DUF4347 domain-containing protein [Trichocoleus sp. ST-U3]|uniref:DUF4347 domain-containing protein n=1 Tax=Coleofasciculus sp. FACHB-542 TaxID=2692787 RepID=UPI001689EB53|nr:DUF4347 domain-containing protein [Coleofasciculus sp. FACHB-542]MBD2087076.1 DUF4347 domain-containing protein [Coleofasciculus sp. FACHB-542]
MQDFWNHSSSNQKPNQAGQGIAGENSSVVETSPAQRVQKIVFIDSTVENYQSLAAGVEPGTEVFILNPMQDGVAQITQVLAGRTDIASVHIVSHGTQGSLQLGSTQLNSSNLEAYTSQLQQWANALTPHADILLYGCDVAAGEVGAAFVQQLSQLTGADIAASVDLTGSASLGGDWDLEVATGNIEANLAFLPGVMQTYNHILPAISLTSGGTYSQNFNTLSTTINTNITWTDDSIIPGWYSNRTSYIASSGVENTGALYSFGSNGSSDRALGAIASGTTGSVFWGVRLVNNTGSTLTSLNIAYTMEQWRANNVTPQTTNFQYKVGAASISEAGYTSFSALNLVSVNNTTGGSGSVDGNNASNSTALTQTLTSFSVNNGEEIWLRWNDPNDTGFDHGLAIDDFSISVPNTAPSLILTAAALPYTENAAATVINSTAIVTDSDSLNFDTGKLTVDFTAGGTASDRIAIRNQGNGAGQIGLDGTIVKYGGVQIGTITGGTGTTPLVVTFNANATPTAATALLQNITYQNVSENPSTTPRTVRFVVTDGDGGTSTAVTETINVTSTNDAPIIGASVIKYDGSLNTTPDDQEFTYIPFGIATQSASGGATTLDTTTTPDSYAGYSPKSVPTLDRATGYTVNFTAQVLSENHTTSTADKNGDGIADRAGFSIIVLSSDKKGIELGFWNNEIWAQEDGTTQANPSANPSASNNQLLFTHAEGATFDTTTGLIPYQLTVLGDTYTLSTGGTTILSGKLRNYTAWVGVGPIDPYETPNFIFFGDGTTSASAKVKLSDVSITTNSSFAPQTVAEDTDLSIVGVSVFDVDAGNTAITVTLEVNNGALTVNSTGLTVNGNGTGTVTLTGTQSQINANLAATNGLLYKGKQDFNGSDTLKITANDGAATSNIKTIPITVTPANDAPVLNNTGSPALTAINEDVALASNNWTLVSEIIASGAGGNPITDADAGAVEGIAVIGVDNTNGTWEYSTDGGSSWNKFVVSAAAATVLKDTTSDLIRFLPNADFNGTVTSGITFRAWDASDGLTSGKTGVNPGAGGGASSFSIDAETVSIIINPVNDAPSFTLGGNQSIAAGAGAQTVTGWASGFNPGAANESSQSIDNYIVNVTSNPGIFASAPKIDPLTGNLTYTPAATIATATTATVAVQVKDNGGTANGGIDTSVLQTFQITVNSGTPIVSIQAIDADAAEAGANTGTYQITRTGNTTGDLTVNLAVDGSSPAIASDYNLSSGGLSVVIPNGQSFVNVTLTAVDDTLPELAETLRLNLATGAGYTIDAAKNNATVAIASNDTIQYAITTASLTLKEGDTGKQTVTFTVTRSGGIGVASTVDYGIGGTATNGIDYNNILVTGGTTALSGTLSFGVGETTKTINLDVLGDTIFEQDETINVTLSKPNLTLAPASSTITTGTAQVTVINDDAKPTVSITPATVTQSEGTTGTSAYTFTVSLSNPSDQPITVNYSTNDGTATTTDGDYIDNDGILTFNPGDPLTKTITVNVKGDNKFEKDETFSVKLNNATNATVNPEANASTAIITNDDSQPIVSIAPATVTQSEGNGVTAYTYTVSLSNPSDQPISVNYSTNDGTATTADGDYTDNDGILTFNPGEPLTKTITVNVKGDNKFEADETFSIKLNSATNANLGNTAATGIIKNDETAGFTVTPISSNTTEAGGTATFTVKLNSQPTANVTLGLTSSDTTEGTVSSPSLTFTANNWNIAQTVTVKGVDDALVDGNIAYNIITAPAVSTDLNYNKLNPVDVAVTNIDNDAAGFTITPISGNTTEAGGAANFTVKLNSQPTANVTLGLGSSDPTEGSVSSPSLTFTSNNWNIAQTITVKGVDDVLVDGNIAYSIVTAPAISTDAKYNGLNPQDVAVVNIDNDTAPLNVINGTWLSETLVGTSLDDRINGFGGHDTIVGGLGKDRIYGDDGNDTLIGDLNNNLLTGGSMGMDDIIYGGTGSDRINGCGGNDTLYGEAGSDQIWGDGGDDRLYGGLGNDILTGGLGRDIFAVSKGEGTDTIRDFQIGQDYIGLVGGLALNQLSIIQQGSNTSIIDNSNNQTLAILAGVNAATFMSNAASTFVSI